MIMVGDHPMDCVQMDVQGPLPRSMAGNRFIIVLIDTFTRYKFAKAIPSQKAINVIKFMRETFLKHGYPMSIQTDRGTNFLSRDVQKYLNEAYIKHKISTAFHPQSQALVERDNRTIGERLRCHTDGQYKRWDAELLSLMLAINTTQNRTTSFTPFYLMHGYEARKKSDNLYGMPTRERDVMIDRRIARTRIDTIQVKTLEKRMQQAFKGDFQVGMFVYITREAAEPGKGKKLSRKAVGPYLISDIHNAAVSIIDPGTKKISVVNINRLKKYKGNWQPYMKALYTEFMGKNKDNLKNLQESEESESNLNEPYTQRTLANIGTPEASDSQTIIQTQESSRETARGIRTDKPLNTRGSSTETAPDDAYLAEDESATEIYEQYQPKTNRSSN